ncbi:MAG: class I SAM-dependent methyltransferase, partial [Thiohalocapsa sp.]
YLVSRSILAAVMSQRQRFQGVVLDVGCGEMPYKPLLTAPGSGVERYLGLDFAANPIHDNQPDLCWEDGRIPLADASVDSALCTEVLEHCPEPDAVLAEVARVLRPGGFLLFTVPFLWPLHEVPYDHYRYTPFALRRHLTNAGFGSIEVHAMGGWDASLAQMLGLWVRRRPMSRPRRRLMSVLVSPLYRWLVNRDDSAAVDFSEGQMVTGLWGTAVKPGSPKRELRARQEETAGFWDHCEASR